jgi:hypothetical protein
MSEIKVNKISPRTACGTTTLGDSGDTFTIPAGVTITNNGTANNFGADGAVSWQTGSIKTSTFTAANGEGYFVNTSGGAVTANLPAGSAGAIVAFSDYTRTFGTNALTINPNGSEKIGGVADDAVLNVNGQAITLVYVDATEGWINVQNAEDTETGVTPAFVAASGGNSTATSGDFKTHIFTGPGTFTVSCAGNSRGSNTVEYLVVAGGGGGGAHIGGGGGGGGTRYVFPVPATGGLAVCAQAYPIIIGGGGSGATNSAGAGGSCGVASSGLGITSAGGGRGGSAGASQPVPGNPPGSGYPGGSGGGSGHGNGPGPMGPVSGNGGSGNTPPTNPPQGKDGGKGFGYDTHGGGGGGGGGCAGVQGADAITTPAGAGTGGSGGNGSQVNICGNNYYWAGGAGGTAGIGGGGTAGNGGLGGGGGSSAQPPGASGTGGGSAINAGGNATPGSNGGNGGDNSGGGGGGGPHTANPSPQGNGGNGGSGIVIIRYKFQ